MLRTSTRKTHRGLNGQGTVPVYLRIDQVRLGTDVELFWKHSRIDIKHVIARPAVVLLTNSRQPDEGPEGEVLLWARLQSSSVLSLRQGTPWYVGIYIPQRLCGEA